MPRAYPSIHPFNLHDYENLYFDYLGARCCCCRWRSSQLDARVFRLHVCACVRRSHNIAPYFLLSCHSTVGKPISSPFAVESNCSLRFGVVKRIFRKFIRSLVVVACIYSFHVIAVERIYVVHIGAVPPLTFELRPLRTRVFLCVSHHFHSAHLFARVLLIFLLLFWWRKKKSSDV